MYTVRLLWALMLMTLVYTTMFVALAFAQEVGVDEVTIEQLMVALSTALQNKGDPQVWIVFFALITSVIMLAVKGRRGPLGWIPTKWIKPEWNIWIVLGLGIVSGVLNSLLTGADWLSALIAGLSGAAIASYGYDIKKRIANGSS